MTNTETLSSTALDVQAIRKKLGKHFSGLPVAELDTDEGRRLFIVRRLLRHAYSLCVRGDALNLLDEADKIKNTAVWLNDIADDIELEE
jgi:hypothetical protein|nr:MAG TPA: hypothetical protein [Caudoviricetes sp.]